MKRPLLRLGLLFHVPRLTKQHLQGPVVNLPLTHLSLMNLTSNLMNCSIYELKKFQLLAISVTPSPLTPKNFGHFQNTKQVAAHTIDRMVSYAPSGLRTLRGGFLDAVRNIVTHTSHRSSPLRDNHLFYRPNIPETVQCPRVLSVTPTARVSHSSSTKRQVRFGKSLVVRGLVSEFRLLRPGFFWWRSFVRLVFVLLGRLARSYGRRSGIFCELRFLAPACQLLVVVR